MLTIINIPHFDKYNVNKLLPLFPTGTIVMTIFVNVKSEKSGLPDTVRRVFFTIYIFQLKKVIVNK